MRFLYAIFNKISNYRSYIVAVMLITALSIAFIIMRDFVPAEQQEIFLSAHILVLNLIVLLSVVVNLYLFKWRRINIENKTYILPEQWAKHIDSLENTITGLKQQITTYETNSAATLDKINELSDLFFSAQKALDEKDSLIKEYKRGYDAEIFRKFLLRFIRILFLLEDLHASKLVNEDGYRRLTRLFNNALEQCGVQSFKPELGTDYRKYNQEIEDDPEEVFTEDSHLDFKIADVTRQGYRLWTESESPIIIPARVKIYIQQ